MNINRLRALEGFGQSIWLDYIDCDILEEGTLARLIENDALAGLTSNPAIFEKAIGKGGRYQAQINALSAHGADGEAVYQHLVLDDIARAADIFHPVYEYSDRRDGYVSVEVSPLLARDAAATITEARALWTRLERPNIMIKVPGTVEGLEAVKQLIFEGINVNVTLLFAAQRYADVVDAWMSGLEKRLERGQPLNHVHSVASFFLSRIDSAVDQQLDRMINGQDADRAKCAAALRGQVAISSACKAYLHYCGSVADPRWRRLAQAGARTQRLLWASTGTKDAAYSDVKYVEALIAPDTVNTLPIETLAAYRDHGRPQPRIEDSIVGTRDVFEQLSGIGIDLTAVEAELEEEGIRKFIEPYRSLLATLRRLRQAG